MPLFEEKGLEKELIERERERERRERE